MEKTVKEGLWSEGQASSIGSRCSGQRNSWLNEHEGGSIHRKVHCSYKINPVAELFSKMRGHKEQLLRAMGFGALMNLPMIEANAVKSVNRQLGFWLLLRLDGATGVLELGEHGRIPITEQDINLVMGVQCIGDELTVSDQSMIEMIKERIKVILMLHESDVLDLDSIGKVLERELPEDASHLQRNAFVVAAAIYAISYFLAPKGRPTRINTEILEALQDPANVFRINWASYVLKTLKECSNKVQSDVRAQSRTVTLDGCLLVLQIAYLDNLNFGEFSTAQIVKPRVQSFTKEIMAKLTNMDKVHNAISQDCRFGKRQIRSASESIYSWGSGRIDQLMTLTESNEVKKLLDHIDHCNDEHRKRLRIKHKEFAEQQLKEASEYHERLTTMVKRWGSRLETRLAKMMSEDVSDKGILEHRTDNTEVDGLVQIGGDTANSMVEVDRDTGVAGAENGSRKTGTTKHVAPRKRIEKRKRNAQESSEAMAGPNEEQN